MVYNTAVNIGMLLPSHDPEFNTSGETSASEITGSDASSVFNVLRNFYNV